MKSKSLILMATYNGEKYIKKQIESIIDQSYKDWNLLIRDDGSKDSTVQIIKEYINIDNRIHLIQNVSSLHGAYVNFWTLLHIAKGMGEYDYYFFSDQDDIWPRARMEWMISSVKDEEAKKPILVYGDMQVIDGKDKLIHESLNEVMGIGQMSGYTEYYSSGFVWGCNAMINRSLFQVVPLLQLNNPHIDIMSHDNYYTKFALSIGEVKYIPQKCIQHRRYGGNTTGNYHMELTPLSVIKKATKGYASVAKTHALGYVQTLQAISMMKEEKLETPKVIDVEKAITIGGIKGVLIMARQRVKRKQLSRTLGIYMVMLLGSYKKYMMEF